VKQLGVDALLPSAALVHQGAVQPAQAADLQHVRRRDPRLREPTLQQQRAQQPRIRTVAPAGGMSARSWRPAGGPVQYKVVEDHTDLRVGHAGAPSGPRVLSSTSPAFCAMRKLLVRRR